MIDDEDDGGDMMSLIIHGRLYGGVIPSAQLAIRMAELVLEGAEGLESAIQSRPFSADDKGN